MKNEHCVINWLTTVRPSGERLPARPVDGQVLPPETCHHVMSSIRAHKNIIVFFLPRYHHHYVPSVVNRSAVMDLHRSRSCATLIQSLYDIFVHSLMLSVHIVLGPPPHRPLLPFIFSSISNRRTPFPLIICPKY